VFVSSVGLGRLLQQWAEVQTLFRKLIPVRPYEWNVSKGGHVDLDIPLFVVGATGWTTEDAAGFGDGASTDVAAG
jgi:hypothetical protein